MARVVIGLSGGVDSSVAAYLLKQQNHEVIGLFMRNWHNDDVIIDAECPWIEDSKDALLVAEKLNIPFQVVDLSVDYKERIVDYMFGEYKAGRTPNPDVLCNREIKYDSFAKIAAELGADYIATGHYCQKDKIQIGETTVHRLLAGADDGKDQSYFLCQLNQNQLSKALFPIGHLQKSEVRDIARTQELVTAEKKDSQGLCFVGKVKLPVFLQQQLKPKKGNIVEIDRSSDCYSDTFVDRMLPLRYQAGMGIVVGEHEGAHYFTIGQRRGLSVGGTSLPLFVIGTDVVENIVYVGRGKDHPGLYRKRLKVLADDIHFVREDLAVTSERQFQGRARIRYRQQLEEVSVEKIEDGYLFSFEEPQRGITSGQFVAWYHDNELLGSGVIQ